MTASKPVIGYAPGVYDLFHIGHLNILRNASELCDVLIAGVVTDEVAFQAKARFPVIPFAERLEIVSSISCVDKAVADHHVDKFHTWSDVGYDVIFKGDDWRGTERADALERDLAAVGARIHYFPYTLSTSSTQLRQFIADSA